MALANVIVVTTNGYPVDTDVVGWRAWYSDGITITRFDSSTSTLSQLPLVNFQCLMLYFGRNHAVGKPYRRVVYGNNFYYVYRDNSVSPSVIVYDQGDIDPTSAIAADPNKVLLKLVTGLTISDVLLQSIVDEAFAAETAP
jgi:hypothetical protein